MSKSTAKQRASRHSYREWTCPCGRVVLGNGGKASHQRACRTYKETKLASMKKTVARWEEDGPDGIEQTLIGQWRREIKDLEKELVS